MVGAVVVLGLAAVAAVAVFGGSDDSQPGCPAGPHLADTEARLCYAVPDRWEPDDGDLIAPLTSSMSHQEGGAAALAGRWEGFFDAPPDGGLGEAALSLASQYAEFFFPRPGERSEVESRDLSVSGRPAGTGSFRIDFDDGEPPVYVRATTVQVGHDQVSFIFTSVPAEETSLRRDADTVHDTLRWLG